jgi:hypothetical protein
MGEDKEERRKLKKEGRKKIRVVWSFNLLCVY